MHRCTLQQQATANTERSSATLIHSSIYTLDNTVDPARFAARQEEKSLVSEGEFPLHPHEEFTGRVDQHVQRSLDPILTLVANTWAARLLSSLLFVNPQSDLLPRFLYTIVCVVE